MARPRRVSDFTPGFWEYAAHQAMSAYLTDAESDLRELTVLVATLRRRRDERKAETERGDWPARLVAVSKGEPNG